MSGDDFMQEMADAMNVGGAILDAQISDAEQYADLAESGPERTAWLRSLSPGVVAMRVIDAHDEGVPDTMAEEFVNEWAEAITDRLVNHMLDVAAGLDLLIAGGCDQAKNLVRLRDHLRTEASRG